MSDRLWRRIAAFAGARAANPTLIVAAIALGWALIMYPKLTIGDQPVGVPELRPDSRYNIDSRVIGQNFAIGVDVLKVFAVGDTYRCVDPHKMDVIARLAWQLQKHAGGREIGRAEGRERMC